MNTYRVEFIDGHVEEVKAQAITSEGGHIVFWDNGAVLVISGRVFDRIIQVDES